MKRAGLYAMLAEIVYCALEVCALITNIVISNPSYYETNYTGSSVSLTFDITRVPAGLQWMVNGSTWFTALGLVANLVMLVLMCVIFSAIFRKYSPKNGFILTVVSVLLPIRAFVLFAIRNKAPFDYDAYMKAQLEELMRSTGVEGGQIRPSDPFEDFPSRPTASPFAEFDDPQTPPADSDADDAHHTDE